MGMANSMAMSGHAVGQLVVISLLASFLGITGWRWTFGILGIVNLVVVLPVVLMVVRGNRRPRTEPSGDVVEGHRVRRGRENFLPPQEILQSSKLWLLLLVFAVCGFQDFFVMTHLVAFADDNGLGSVLSGNLLALMGVMGLAGVITTGWVSDKFGPMWPTTFCFMFRILIFVIALFFQNTVGITTFALLYGSTLLITAPLVMVYPAKLFGHRHLGTVAGIIMLVHQLFGGLGAFMGGWFYDRALDYDGTFIVMIVLAVVAVPLAIAIGSAQTRLALPSKH
jgi:predicted MFS family arabinose efflux permease